MPIEHLPEPMKPTARRFRDWCLDLGPLLLCLGVVGVNRGIAYLPVTPPIERAPHPVENVLPMDVWGWAWIVASLFAICAAVQVRRMSAWGVGLMAGLNGVWWVSYTLDSVVEQHWLNMVPATMHMALTAIPLWAVWRGVREPKPTRGEVASELRRD